ncbi:protein TolQ [Sphingomonas sp. G-3-2-10]|jgi:biopolymer transport protein TolQ|uniref:protein TolQ n=1 Tax=Sphingomonas sp. G-3-2-10 TaxID=2728838 RepID=UPI00146A7879|nr:protein TolQ [Sphingomonas sp. G-3-2-10]NML07009.1 protein TolQ [Sphingomonas sp. G-3-2-10]
MDFLTNADPTSLVGLIVQAHWIVKLVMAGLFLASLWSWAITISFGFRISGVRKAIDKFEGEYREADDIDEFHRRVAGRDQPIARVFSAGVTEWRRSTSGKAIDREGTRERLATAMGATIANEIDRLADRLNFLATVGSVAPFVGLFGTVVGIMNSFTKIVATESSSITAVAPGIAEALFATAIGLAAAIPAVIAYNAFSHRINRVEQRLNRFADGFHATLSRRLELEA